MNDLDERIDDIKDMLEMAKYCETEQDLRLRLENARSFLNAMIAIV